MKYINYFIDILLWSFLKSYLTIRIIISQPKVGGGTRRKRLRFYRLMFAKQLKNRRSKSNCFLLFNRNPFGTTSVKAPHASITFPKARLHNAISPYSWLNKYSLRTSSGISITIFASSNIVSLFFSFHSSTNAYNSSRLSNSASS